MPDEPAEDTAASDASDVAGSMHPEDGMPFAELDARARADAAIRRIAAGSDPGREAFDLANAFTDESVSRIRATIIRWFRRD
ncbi:hypothetical protein [Curtobacterium sp. RRHDQ10]|uniref:hypothetical protein n=1 Tax=Curtobacterium phyllosphaerae TaxID=3413379 RepID=UPI003BF3F669